MDFGSVLLFFLLIGLAIYFLPTIIAMARGKRNALAIFAMNLLLGWSFIGWAIALVWSLTAEDRGQERR